MTSDKAERFQQVPWCAELLRDSNWIKAETSSRQPKPLTTEDSFFAETLQTERTISNCLTLHRKADSSAEPNIPEVRTLLELGNGVNGHPGLLHGGFVATILDEVMGVLLTLNVDLENRIAGTERGLGMFTAYLNVQYKKPVPASSVVMTTAKVIKAAPRKRWAKGTVEDGNGTVFATAEALFIEPRKTKL